MLLVLALVAGTAADASPPPPPDTGYSACGAVWHAGWATAALPQRLEGMGVATVADRIYVLGGWGATGAKDTVRFADLGPTGAPTFTTTTALPSRVEHPAAATDGQFLWVTGGDDGGTLTDRVSITEPGPSGLVPGWASGTALPRRTSWHSAVWSEGHLYVAGGLSGAWSPTRKVYVAPTLPTGAVGAWTETTPLPTRRYSVGLVALPGVLFAIGGTNNAGDPLDEVLRAAVAPDGSLGPWVSVGALPQPIASMVVERGGDVFLAGGAVGSGLTGTSAAAHGSAAVQELLPPMPGQRFGNGVAVAGSWLYSLGGYRLPGTLTDTVYWSRVCP